MLKEIYTLIKLLFTKIQLTNLEVITMKHFPFKGYLCMAWCGKIIVRGKRVLSDTTLQHEKIHTLQAYCNYNKWYKFYLKYVWYWLIGNPIIKPYNSAYYTNPFEMEAYANENNPDYIVSKYSYKKYIIKNKKQIYKEHKKDWKQFIKAL